MLLYEDSDQRHAIRRKYLTRQLEAPLQTTSLQLAQKQWTNRLLIFLRVFGHEAFLSINDELTQLMSVLPRSFAQFASTLQSFYAFHGYPSHISHVFERL